MTTSVAGYTLLRKLGAGGQGEVWLAHDEEQGEDIALKVATVPGGRSDPLWLALEAEYGTSRLLDHPGILRVGRPVRDGDTALLPMEYASGGDLRPLRGAGYLEIVPVLIEIAQALDYAHAHSIVHRDLKPGNVLLDKDRRIRLSDFGLSGGVSPFSASPQQLEGAPASPADDIYGLGALAYELLSGAPPYHPHFDLQRALKGPVPPLKPQQPAPAPLVKLVHRMLSRDPKARPRSMRQVIEALEASLNDTLIFDRERHATVSAAIAANETLPSPETLRAHALRGHPLPPEAEAAEAREAPRIPQRPAPQSAAPTPSTLPPTARTPSARTPAAPSGERAPATAPPGVRTPAAPAPSALRPAPARAAPPSSTPGAERPRVEAPPPRPRPARVEVAPPPPEPARPRDPPPREASPPPRYEPPAPPPPRLEPLPPPPQRLVPLSPPPPRPAFHAEHAPPGSTSTGAVSQPITALPPLNLQYTEPKFPAIEPVQWDAIRARHPASLMRIEPSRSGRWIFLVLILAIAGLGAAWTHQAEIRQWLNDAPPLAALVPPAATASGGAGTMSAGAGAALSEAAATPAGRETAAQTNNPLVEQQTRAARAQFEQQLAGLNQRAASVWGGAEFASAQSHAAEGAAAMSAGDFGVAAARYKEALALLDIVAKRASAALAAELASGDQALAAGQSEVARQDFELARQIDPQNRRAEQGLRRARGLTGVLPLLGDAASAEQARNYPRALQDYSQALALDPDNEQAKKGLQRANAALGEDSYARAVGSGFAALGAGRLDEARVAFENARNIRPAGKEAAEGLGRVGAALRARGFNSTRSRAAAYEAQERWADALQEYQQALQLDSSLGFAQAGRARALARRDLSDRLDSLISNPGRLADSGVRAEAASLLNQARAATPSGPLLRSQTSRLASLMASYDKPVRLALLSDNATRVEIQKVGTFGTFSRREVQLKPGRYTVVGTRAGFREVRRDVTVAPGQSQSIHVTCFEPI